MNIIKSLFVRIIFSLAIAQSIAKEFPKYEDILLISLTILLVAFLTYLSKKF